jgi:hypothetical protein
VVQDGGRWRTQNKAGNRCVEPDQAESKSGNQGKFLLSQSGRQLECYTREYKNGAESGSLQEALQSLQEQPRGRVRDREENQDGATTPEKRTNGLHHRPRWPAEDPATSNPSNTIHIMKVPKWYTMRIFTVGDKYVVNYQHHEGA